MTVAEQTLVIERTYAAPITRVFDAFADVSKFAQWFGPSTTVNLEIFEYNFEKDGRYRIGFKGESGTTDIVAGIYVSITPPTQIVFTWVWEAPNTYADHDTLVTIGLTEAGAKTQLTLTHEKLPSTEAKENHNQGWTGAFDSLEEFFR